VADQWDRLSAGLEEFELYLEMASDEKPEELAEVERAHQALEHELEKAETAALMSGEYDRATAILTVHAGAGGVDAQDWAEMLLRMYLRWAEREGLKAEVVDVSAAEEAGVHSATAIVSGPFAFGLLSSERGVHRLVRISPFDQQKRRHTAFAKVDVLPELADEVPVEIRPEDLKVDTYRSQGAGGQHVNKTESAIRITHLPTGTVVACQNERSQHSNRETAMRMLRSKLFELQLAERQGRLDAVRGENREAAWANQIRNYVLQPYTMVKDRRTGAESGDVQSVLDGNLTSFMRSWLEARARLGREPVPTDGGGAAD
jgi:peptide chain release factor 2